MSYAQVFDLILNSSVPLTDLFDGGAPENPMDWVKGFDNEITARFNIGEHEFTSTLVAAGKLTLDQYQRIRIAMVILTSHGLFDAKTIEDTIVYLKNMDDRKEPAVSGS